MHYQPHSPAEIKEMLDTIGVSDIEDLLGDIPKELRAGKDNLPQPLSEPALRRLVEGLAAKNRAAGMKCFLGAGAYDHFIPSVVGHLLLRGEFFTAYTPYQPEASQGTLQAMYEYQSMVCELTGMDVSNASLYDGATAAAEAMLLSLNQKPNAKRVVVSEALHPDWRHVLKTYARHMDASVHEVPAPGGVTDPQALAEALKVPAACLIVQNPNFYGCLESLPQLAKTVHAAGALFVVASYPISLGLIKPPGECGADIVVGEGQCLGNALGYGGPYLGIFACKDALKRRLPGRVVGRTTDAQGRQGYVLTMQAREQHIRREKATSNICTNQSLLALAASIYLAAVGKEGFCHVARTNALRAESLRKKLLAIPGVKQAFARPHFNEFVLALNRPVADVLGALQQRGILGGVDLGRWYPNLRDHLLVCATETKTEEDLQEYADAFAKAMQSKTPVATAK